MNKVTTSNTTSQKLKHKVTLLEIIAVFLGAIILLILGVSGLALKFFNNALESDRAEAIASKIASYKFPSRSQGALGLNTAGAKVAIITSGGNNPDIRLLVAKVVIDSQPEEGNEVEQIIDGAFLGDKDNFQITTSDSKSKQFCGVPTNVTVDEGITKAPNDSQGSLTISYKTSVVIRNNRYFVLILAQGEDAPKKAESVFNSLKCKLPEVMAILK
jgi:hypothetical protein